MKFDELNLDTHLLMAIYENGYLAPTPIQEKSIPIILSGKNFVGRSETGSGKTLAFLIPILQKINLEIFGAQALIICPTRELSMQVCEEAKTMAKSYDSDIRVVSLNGGADFDRQRRELKKGAQLVVGTVGRIEEHIEKKSLNLEKLSTIVLDEADEMLTLGFREDVEFILNRCPKNIQTILFSATFPQEIKNIIKKFIKDEVYVEIGKENTTVSQVKQYFIYQKDKVGLLKQLVLSYKDKKILVFANTKSKVEELYKELKTITKTMYIHGDIMQNERHKAMQEFKSGFANVLIATDVASRGIDISDIFMVVNFELPFEIEYYIHRVGRTARAGKEGIALTLIHNKVTNRKIIELAEILKTPITEMVLDNGKLYESEFTYIPQDKPQGLWVHEKKNDGNKPNKAKTTKGGNNKNSKKPNTDSRKTNLKNKNYSQKGGKDFLNHKNKNSSRNNSKNNFDKKTKHNQNRKSLYRDKSQNGKRR